MSEESPRLPSPEHTERFREALLGWYGVNRRPLPWRHAPDLYTVWLAEIMLQQTRVDQALPYYERFLEAFPTLEDVARADLDEVLVVWEGLGYYARARNFHAAARLVVSSGVVPRTFRELLRLPGLGPYTARAVASIPDFDG